MLTVGLAKEIFYISHVLKKEINVQIQLSDSSKYLWVNMKPDGDMTIFYGHRHIWKEQVEGDSSFFGIESCDSISRIIACIDNDTSGTDESWKNYSFGIEKA